MLYGVYCVSKRRSEKKTESTGKSTEKALIIKYQALSVATLSLIQILTFQLDVFFGVDCKEVFSEKTQELENDVYFCPWNKHRTKTGWKSRY